MDWGMKNRITKLIKPESGRAVWLAMDHGYFLGAVRRLEKPGETVRPLLPYADAIDSAKGGFAPEPPPACLKVHFTPAARTACEQLESGPAPGITRLIRQMLALDPRPAYAGNSDPDRHYGFRVLNVDVRWKVAGDRATVIEINPVN